ncbi:MAG TPA: AAA family ATPase [Streptosporangiaceae bacterium]|nr:AAA family ATPase [Streptosporangiaceae bacterium]
MSGGCVGRDEQLQALEAFLDDSRPVGCLVLVGDAGIGKTTVWEAGLRLAGELGCRVLSTRASQAETGLPFAALADLVEGVEADVATVLPGPQRHALDVATRRADPGGMAPDPLAISAGFLNLLRAAAESEPLLVAVDDVQWLDPSSAGSLLFAARRVANHGDGRIRFLLCKRPGRQTALEGAFRNGLERIALGPLSIGAIQHLLSARLRLVLPHRVLRQVFEVSQGNPLFALELGRTMAQRGVPEPGAELPIPDIAEDLFGERIRGLAAPARRVLLATALSADVGWLELSRLADPFALDQALSDGLITVERSRVRPSHPLLGAAVRRVASVRERRELHAALASAVDDLILRARHLAMAAAGPDEGLAETVAGAAAAALERAALHEAEQLAAQALRLSPAGSAGYPDRLLALARCHLVVGDSTRTRNLLGHRLEDLPPGSLRAQAHLLLAEALAGVADGEVHLGLALAEAGEDAEIRARALAGRATLLTVSRVRQLNDAERIARDALRAADRAGAEARHRALTALAWTRIMRGRPIDDLRRSAPPSPDKVSFYGSSMDRPHGVRLVFRGEMERARTVFQHIRDLTEEYGDIRDSIAITVQRCELELRAGDVVQAARLLDEIGQWESLEPMPLLSARLHAMAAAVAGFPAEAAKWATVVLRDTNMVDDSWNWLEVTRALGIAAIFDRDPQRAAEQLRVVWEHTQREKVGDPGAFPVAGDLVEALVLCGDIDAGRVVTGRLSLLAARQKHPWGRVTARRCSALLRLADGGDDDAAAELADAAGAYARLGLRYEQGRTLLSLGCLQRRYNKRGAARDSLTEAHVAFDALGCAGWSARAADELSRVSGRRTAGDALTVSERRAAELAAEGLSNKEIAGQLYVSVYTVEAHLSHAYAKLGVRSRGQLAARLTRTQ